LSLWQNREQHSAEAEEVIAEPITLPGDGGKNKTKKNNRAAVPHEHVMPN